jgi:hypothetical protein
MMFDFHNDFEQCAANPCAFGCTFPGNSSAVIAGATDWRSAHSSKAVVSSAILKRQYLRAASEAQSNSSIGRGASDAAASSESLS